jgi:hypothetical protein
MLQQGKGIDALTHQYGVRLLFLLSWRSPNTLPGNDLNFSAKR